jgi:RNA polymerase sigma factor (sigma-70 family)
MASSVDEEEIFLRLVDQHRGIIRKVAAGYCSTPADRHDLSQEIMLQLWKAYPRYSPDRPFSTWMYRIALNVAISFLRRNTRPIRQTVPLEEIDREFVDENVADPESDERLALLQRFIATLDPLNRALLLLYLDDHIYRDIATILGITETNVATKLSRLKERLRQNLTKENH